MQRVRVHDFLLVSPSISAPTLLHSPDRLRVSRRLDRMWGDGCSSPLCVTVQGKEAIVTFAISPSCQEVVTASRNLMIR